MTRLKMLIAAAPLSSFCFMQEDFVQPSLEGEVQPGTEVLPVTEAPLAVDNSAKTDELSEAVRAQEQPVIVVPVEPIKPAAPYILEYLLDGLPIREAHSTVPHALASVRRLKQLGIIPATSTV